MSLHFPSFKNSPRFVEHLWDAWCIASLIGIWPRFIEPSLLFTSHHTLAIHDLPKDFNNLCIVQISDLHDCSYLTQSFLLRISERVMRLKPDIIVFTGDLLSYSEITHKELLQNFLSSLSAPLGCFAIFGNHDYREYVSLDDNGLCRLIKDHTPPLLRGFSRLFSSKQPTSDPEVSYPIEENKELRALYEKSGFEVLHNESRILKKGTGRLNITGLGDIMAMQCLPYLAFSNIDPRYPTIVLSHNPDSYSLLESYPGDLFLFGHTHGGQINLPYIWKKITPIKNKQLKSGLVDLKNRFLYINRGLGSTFPFRWFAPPEITKITLIRSGPQKNTFFMPFLVRQKGQEGYKPFCANGEG